MYCILYYLKFYYLTQIKFKYMCENPNERTKSRICVCVCLNMCCQANIIVSMELEANYKELFDFLL